MCLGRPASPRSTVRGDPAAAAALVLALALALLSSGRAGGREPSTPLQPTPAPGPGVFLVAEPHMPDPRFARSVILLIEHGPSGSFGLIVNRPSVHAVHELFPQLGETARRHRLWFGGPVAPYTASFLVRTAEPLPGTIPVLESLRYGTDPATLAVLMERGLGPEHLHVYLGYAGWGPGQLDGELREGVWFLAPAGEGEVMSPEALWERLMERRAPTGVLVHAPGFLPESRQFVSF